MAFNLELLRKRAADIRQAIALLQPIGALTLQEFESNLDRRDATLFRLQIAVESAQAICNHVAAHLPTRVPDSLPDCFRALEEKGLLSVDLTERLVRMARFRNLLVHRYWELDYGRVLDIVRNHLSDLIEFLSSISQALKESL